MSVLTQTDKIALAKLEPILLRAKVETPVVTSLAQSRSGRPLVRAGTAARSAGRG